MSYQENEVLKKLPLHLKQFINNQNYESYTAIDQSVWRYVMRKNVDFLKKVAHHSYINGLTKTGISIDKIPSMYGMNRILKEIGWAAIAVDGFIPPSAFMEFQAYNVLVIAQDIRQIGHIEYTPAPDILHEAAGHAPIIANPEYSEYLRRFGEVGSKAISSAKDFEMYEAIRHLSIIKEDQSSTEKEIQEGEEKVLYLQDNMCEPSEMARIRNLHWWTVEYGLIGSLDNPKIYGAGLLSSIGESKSCLEDTVKKIPYSILAADQAFDITKPQPQLYVTPDFAHLSFVLEEFAGQMALRKGGAAGVKQLIDSKNIGTVELNTGIQISGIFSEIILDKNNRPIYIKTQGATALANRDNEMIGHGVEYHKDGFGSPIGKLKNINIAIENMSPFDLEAYKIREGEQVFLEFEGNITIEGEVITGKRNRFGKIQLISFRNCTVKHRENVLFHPDWGIYDMAVGSKVISAHSGPADVNSFDLVSHVPEEKTHKIPIDSERAKLIDLYQKTSKLREENNASFNDIDSIFEGIQSNQKREDHWLVVLELYEYVRKNSLPQAEKLADYLKQLQEKYPEKSHLIQEGLEM